MQVASKRATISELLAHPWIAQYSNPKDARIPAYHPTQASTAPSKAAEEGAPSSVLDAAKALSSTGEASAHPGADVLAETVRPVRFFSVDSF